MLTAMMKVGRFGFYFPGRQAHRIWLCAFPQYPRDKRRLPLSSLPP
jgi:hypothetical protein